MLEKAGDVISGVTKVYFLKNGKQMVTRFPKGRTITLNPDTWQEAREMWELLYFGKKVGIEWTKASDQWLFASYPAGYLNEWNDFIRYFCSHLPKEEKT
jgi:hypothetical protein